MIELLKLLVFLWLTGWAVWSVKRLVDGQTYTVLFCILGTWFFCGAPLFLDAVAGAPNYSLGHNLSLSGQDLATNLVYTLFVATIPPLLYVAGAMRVAASPLYGLDVMPVSNLADQPRGSNAIFYALLALPPVTLIGAPQPSLYWTYGFHSMAHVVLSPEVMNYNAIVQLACVMAVISGALLVRKSRSPSWTVTSTMPMVLIAFYLAGKRAIILFYAVLLTKSLWDRGELKGVKFPIYLAVIGLLFTTFTFAYQAGVRGISLGTTQRADYYENLRVDYGRDHTIKLAIYAELRGDQILNYRGESVVFNAGMYIPRKWWPDKPLPYATYQTCYALGIKPQLILWGLTTSIYDEAIANFGWLGMPLGPIFLGLCCRFSDGNRNSLLRIAGMLVCLLLLVLQLTAFMPLFLFWFAASLVDHFRPFLSLRVRSNTDNSRGSP